MKRVVVVGASLAGVSAAEGLRDRGFDGEIHLIGAEDEEPYSRPPLSKDAMAGGAPQLSLHEPSWYGNHGVQLHLAREVVSLDTHSHQVMDRRGTVHSYDGLVIATGCTARRLPAQLVGPGAQELIFTLRTAADARLLAKQLHSGQRMVVIGAGFIGMELASTATKLGVEVSVVDIAATPLNRVFGDVIGNWFTDMHRRNGVNVRCSTTVQSIRRSSDALEVRLDSNERLLADVVVAGIGGVPAVDWLAGSRVATDNGVLCRPDLQTAVPGVVAAGDVAVWHNNAFGESMRIEHWTNAVEQGRHAAGRLLGEDLDFTSIPYFWTDQFESKLRFVGRANPSDDIVVETLTDESLVALFGRGGVLRGAVCVNAPRKLALYRRAINDSTAWADVAHVGTATSCVTRTT